MRHGGANAPYIWLDANTLSWQAFDMLLERAQLICTPGDGFGPAGAGYVRLTAFGTRENALEAARRLSSVF